MTAIRLGKVGPMILLVLLATVFGLDAWVNAQQDDAGSDGRSTAHLAAAFLTLSRWLGNR
jgi:hypothetical protein